MVRLNVKRGDKPLFLCVVLGVRTLHPTLSITSPNPIPYHMWSLCPHAHEVRDGCFLGD